MLLLTKDNGSLNLSKQSGSPEEVNFALSWDGDFDLDAFTIGVRGTSVLDDDDVLYFNSNKYADPKRPGKMKWVDDDFRQPYIWDKAMVHSGDELSGGKEGDDEVITVKLLEVPRSVTEIAFCVTFFTPKARDNFSRVPNSFIRLDNAVTGEEMARLDLKGGQVGSATGVVFGYLTKENDEWIWESVLAPQNGDMNQFMKDIKKVINAHKATL